MLASLPPQERQQFLASLSETESAALEYDWSFWGRKNQIAPPGDWATWLIVAGRGFGKTRAGAEWVRSQVCGDTPLGRGRCRHIALVAETAADARKVMVGDGFSDSEGSGLLQVHPKDFRPEYNPSLKRVIWPNGAIASLYNATEPDELRGPQHDGAWCDELAKWRYGQETWDQLEFGLRLGDPRTCITTTPRPIKLLKDILADPATVVTTGSTYENADNLSPEFIAKVVRKYEGTRLGRQELKAEILDDVPGALWTRAMIDAASRKMRLPDMQRVVVSIDPSGAGGEDEDDSDEIGIVVCGKGVDGRGYVLADYSCRLSPAGWGRRAVEAYREHRADRIIAERNFGGAMVEHVIRTVDKTVSYEEVVASRGKVVRAEPIAALYEQGRITHAGTFPDLEDQMCAMTRDGYALSGSPDRVDALVWALDYLAFVSKGPMRITPAILSKSRMPAMAGMRRR